MGINQSNPSKEESLKINALNNTITHILKFLSVKDCHNVASICKETSLNRYIYHIIFDKNPNIFAKFFLQKYIAQSRLDFYLSFKHLINPLEPYKNINYEIPLVNASFIGNLQIVNALIKAGSNLEQYDYRKDTPLYSACESGKYKTVKILFDAGASKKKYFIDWHNSPFTIACNRKQFKTVKLLIKEKYEIIQKDIDNAILKASYDGWSKMVKLLLSIGANVNYQERFHNITPLIYAVESECEETVKILLEANADPEHFNTQRENSIMIAIRHNNLKILKILLNTIADINFHNYIIYAILKKSTLEIVRELILRGADVNNPNINDDNNTALIYAAKDNNLKLVKLLIQSKANIKHKNNSYMTAIIYAFKNRNIKMVKMLINSTI